ncbi:MAG: hypothetical protein K0R38_6265 [Polyangiaceae bacterium]|jgi:uncharacterized membrane protein YedE/YeeE|nr:hypothetical protein [Polyangiaceae bacterium]
MRGAFIAAVGLFAGLLFGVGLVIGGMTDPAKVRGFLDFMGEWDPTLAFVMGGAIAVHFLAYRMVRGRPTPVLARRFQIPTRRDVDAKLLAGAAAFGLGWGLGGYCPGPAVTSLSTGAPGVLAFVGAMLGAAWLTARAEDWVSRRRPGAAEPPTVDRRVLTPQ